MKISDLFDVCYGNKCDLNKLEQVDKGLGVAFVGRSANNNGVTAYVKQTDKEPYEAGLITVALGGSILSTFLHDYTFYTGQNIAVLKPRISISTSLKLFYCKCIEMNRFKYTAFGREANTSLRDLEVPDLYEAYLYLNNFAEQSRAEQSRAEQSRAEQSRAEQSNLRTFVHSRLKNSCERQVFIW